MKSKLYTHRQDPVTKLIANLLEGRTLDITVEGKQGPLEHIVLEGDHQIADPRGVALFSVSGTLDWPNRHLRMPPFQINGGPPAWCRETPFTVGVRLASVESTLSHAGHRAHDGTLPQAIRHMLIDYAKWVPGGLNQTPWHIGGGSGLSETTRAGLHDWLGFVREVYVADFAERALEGVTPIWGDAESLRRAIKAGNGRANLFVMGCAPFNDPHTDVAIKLRPDKAIAAREEIERFLRASGAWIQDTTFVVVSGDFMGHPALKASLHPFFFRAIADLEEKLGRTFDSDCRLGGRVGVRTDEEIAEVLEFGYRMIDRELVTPIRQAVNLPIATKAWTDAFPRHYFDEGAAMASENPAVTRIIEEIYEERVRTREWYKTVADALGSDAGLERTRANVAIYLAIALWMRDNPDAVNLDTEVDDQFWIRLGPVLKEIWGDNVPFIGHIAPRARQPWAY